MKTDDQVTVRYDGRGREATVLRIEGDRVLLRVRLGRAETTTWMKIGRVAA